MRKRIITKLKKIAGLKRSMYLIPDALNAVISLFDDNLPNVIKVVTNTAIGIARDIIHAEFNNINLKTVPIDNPFPRNLSKFFKINCESKTNIKINNVVIKGVDNSFNRYLFKIFIRFEL
tara:strand:- start:1276 stop:1635 length:360 start_codon:yes stop_codon:yes gene_type:complete